MDHYRAGRGALDTRNFSAALTHFQTGLADGDLRCSYGLVALAAMTGSPMEEPTATLRESLPAIAARAERGDAEAGFILGRCYEMGCAVERSLPDAITWYLRSAAMGNADAMFNLGCIYMSLGPEAHRLALDQFRQAAEHGSPEARLALAQYPGKP
ncbi:MAG: sel1 repeat family protein [Oscillospiraceae bacterium]|nr:sel1 repeat family protein [Oscillospiraceae bacterium]